MGSSKISEGLIVLLVFMVAAAVAQISNKGQKFTTTTEDPFFSFDEPTFDVLDVPENNADDEDIFGADAFDDFQDPFADFPDFEESLRPCSELTEDEVLLGVSCDNSTLPEPEIRIRDPLFERLLTQSWSDYQAQMNDERSLYGVVVDPLDVDAFLPKPIDISQNGAGYSADVKMSAIKVYGLSGINMSESVVTRSENLTDIDIKVTFSFDKLVINGTYSLKGFVTFWSVDSGGDQDFNIRIKKADFTYGMKMELVDPDSDWAGRRCDDRFTAAQDQHDVLITEIRFPLLYEDVDFRFDNLGNFANTMVNGIGMYLLQTQEDVFVDEIRKAIKKNVNSLIC